jgi:8-oxo-dGTP diphosphatase
MPKISAEPVLVGCELLIRKDGKLLLGLRGRKCFGAGTWALPGGHLEFGESLIAAACREVKEELGAEVKPGQLRLASIVDDLPLDGSPHYIHVSFEMKNPGWQPRIMEPDECDEWRYFELDNLPTNFFPPHKGIVDNYLNQKLYSTTQ